MIYQADILAELLYQGAGRSTDGPLRLRDFHRLSGLPHAASRMLSHLHKGHLRVVDAHDAYWPPEAEESDGPAVLDELIAAMSAAEPPVLEG